MSLEGYLSAAGLQPKEAKVYLSLLELGKSTLSKVANNAHMSHVTTLFYLRKLEEKKLLTRKLEGKQKCYYIQHPKHGFRFYLQLLKDEIYQKECALMDSLEDFEVKYDSLDKKPEVKFFQGEDAKSMFKSEMNMTKLDQLYEFTNLDQSLAYKPAKRGDHRSRFRRLRLKSKVIYLSSNGAILPLKEKNVFSYLLPQEKYNYSGEIFTFGNKIFFTRDTPDKASVVIKDTIFAESMRNLFELAIEGVMRYQPKNTKTKKYSDLFSSKKAKINVPQPPSLPLLV